MTVTVDDDSAAGIFRNEATATALCEGGPVDARTDVATGVELEADTAVDVPEVTVPDTVAEGEGPPLAATGGGATASLFGLLAVGLGAGLWRRRR